MQRFILYHKMKIGKYFTKQEFEHSATAVANNISNKMNAEELKNATDLVKYVLDPLREYSKTPIFINSGFRSAELNNRLKSVKNSQHLTAQAVDIETDAEAFDFIREHLPFDQLIWEFGTDKKPQWVHVSYCSQGNRNQVLKAVHTNGRTVYKRI